MNPADLRAWLVARIAATLRVDPTAIDDRAPLADLGLASTDAVTLSGELEELLGRDLSPTLVYEHPSIAALADHLARPGAETTAAAAPVPPAGDGGAAPGPPIAVVGLACRFPGAGDPGAFWRLLRDGVDAVREVPPERWDAGAVYHPDPSVPGKAVSRWGGFLDQVDRFEPFFFGISPGEAERMDPQQRLLLELAYEAFDDAGHPPARLAGTDTGVFVGISVNEYAFLQHDRRALIDGHSGTGNALSIAANRISYFFDLHGPSLAVDTACSSSLAAVHLACRSLRAGECSLAVAGGVNVVLSPAHSIAFTKAGVLARDGRCKVFDARADGYVRGEGGGLVVLKPLARALADGDPIHCVIRGSAVRQEGHTNGLMAPGPEAQEAVLRAAWRDAGAEPARARYVEAHGTGTLLGDAVEARALGAVVGAGRTDGPCLVGSVKTNFGHLEAAAGIAGLIKVALALRQGTVPPSLHFAAPNPHVPFDELGLRVASEPAPWPGNGGPRLAGVSSFGFGGTDVHVVVEEAPGSPAPGGDAPAPGGGAPVPGNAEVLPIAAHGPQALAARVRGYRDLLAGAGDGRGGSLSDLCAAAGRGDHPRHRTAVVVRSAAEAVAGLERFLSGPGAAGVTAGEAGERRLAFVFSGQGSQWHGMGRGLLRSEPAFGAALEECEQVLRPHTGGWSLLEQLEADPERSRLAEIDVLQPALFALQVALARLWRSWGIVPGAVVGHSLGEVAAACVAGALTLEEAARVVCLRSRLLRRLRGRGGMAVVGLAPEATAHLLAEGGRRLAIAAENGPESTVVAGEIDALEELVTALERRQVFARRIDVDVASHGPQTRPLAAELRGRLAGLRPRPAAVLFVSTVTGAVYDGELGAAYWARNLTEPVRFTAAVRELARAGCRELVEIAPHPVLGGAVQQSLIGLGAEGAVFASTRRDRPEREAMLESLAALYAGGRTVDWRAVHRRPAVPVARPPYPWQRQRYWIDAAAGPASAAGDGDGGPRAHPLLGRRLGLAREPGAAVWHRDLDDDSLPFLRDHRVGGRTVVPAAAFVEMALAAAAGSGIAGPHALVDLRLHRSLPLAAGERRTLQVARVPGRDGGFALTVHGRPAGGEDGDWTLHATAEVAPEATAETGSGPGGTGREGGECGADGLGGADGAAAGDLEAIRRRLREEVPAAELYRALAARGLEYGPALRAVERVWRRDGEALGRVVPAPPPLPGSDGYHLHPALLDGAMQVIAAALSPAAAASGGGAWVPVACRRVRLHRPPGEAVWSHAVLRPDAAPPVRGIEQPGIEPPGIEPAIEVDLRLLGDSGETVAELTGLRLAPLAADRDPRPAPGEPDLWRYRVEWRPAPWPETGPPAGERPDRWLILADRGGLGEALRRRLEADRRRCILLEFDEPPAAGTGDGDGDTAGARSRDGAVRAAIRARLEAETAPLAGVVHLWSADDEPAAAHSARSLGAAQARGAAAALHLVQGLLDRGADLGAPRLWLVTRGLQPVQPGEPVSLAQAPLWGLGRTVGFELPHLGCTLVDLDPTLEPAAAAEQLTRQLAVADGEDQVVLRGDGRWVPRLVPFDRSDAAPATLGALRPDATYLITGGLGGLGLAVAGWMVERGARHLALVGRSAPSAAAAAALERLRGAGAEVALRRADVADEAELGAVLAAVHERMPPLRGVVHAAGVLDDAPIAELDSGRLARVLAPKVEGAWNLHAGTAGEPLDFFVLFSSAVSVLGSPGQGNYAAANTFLDTLAHYRRRLGLPAVSIDWGPWLEVGLVAGGDFLPASPGGGGEGVKGIAPKRGLEALGRALGAGAAQLAVLPFDVTSLLELYPAAAALPFFAEVGGGAAHVARLYARPDLRQEYLAPRTEVERRLAELWRQTLRIDRVGVRDSFFELGGDSVLAGQIVAAAHRAFGVRLDVREAFSAFTIEELARRIEAADAGGPIVPRPPGSGPGPLSFVQERQLFLELLEPRTAVNNLAVCVRMTGALDLERLRASANRVAARHETLRTSFDLRGRPAAVIATALEVDLGTGDLGTGDLETGDPGALEGDRAADALRLATLEARRPFDLESAPLWRVRTYRLAAGSHLLLVAVHHAVADGWSLGVFLEELLAGYRALADPAAAAPPPPPIQYGDFAAWQRRAMDGPLAARQLDYWRRQLGGELSVLDLATDRPRPALQTFAGAGHSFRLDAGLAGVVRALGRRHDATPFMTLLAGLLALLHRWSGQDDLVIGTPTAGRTQPETAGLIGAFINTLALRGDLSGDPCFAELLRRVRATALAAYAHQDVPFEKLVAELRAPRDLSRTPVFQVLFTLHNSPLPALEIPELSLELVPIERGAVAFDLELTVTETGGGLDAVFDYNADLFDPATIERLASAFRRLLADAAERPETPVSALAVMSEAERRHLVAGLNRTSADYPRERRVDELFEAQAARTPDALALVCGEAALSYRELDRRASALAAELGRLNVGPGDRVGVRVERSPHLVAALLAVWKAGGAYLPIDPRTPAERVAFLLGDAEARAVLTGGGRAPVAAETVATAARKVAAAGGAAPAQGPDHLAYVVYTSGSTGRPKGVGVTHRALVNLLWSMRALLRPAPGDRLLAVTSVSFDIAALELFLPLVAGATVVVADDETRGDPRRLRNAVAAHRVRFLQATPAAWRLLLAGGWAGTPDLVALCGGEPLPPDLAGRLLEHVETLWNVYGPTETTVWSSAARVRRGRPITIGEPLANTRLHVLDRWGRPAPLGAAGELYIGGDGVSPGYLGRPGLTALRFVPDPLAEPGGEPGRLFRTGDRARRRADGSLELLGRLDSQVKIHGVRVEPGEVEAALGRHPGVRATAVVAHRGAGGHRALLAAFVPAGEPAPSPRQLRDFLRDLLPAALVPAAFVALPALPLTPAGKIDRRALAALAPVPSGPTFVAPRTPLEGALAGISAQVLGVDRVGVDDNFFDLGGGSIQILEFIVRAAADGVELTPEAFFEHQTMAELAASLGEGVDGG